MKRSDIIDFLYYTASVAAVYELLKPRPTPSEVLRAKIERRLAELRDEEIRLVATRSYIIELWELRDDPTRQQSA